MKILYTALCCLFITAVKAQTGGVTWPTPPDACTYESHPGELIWTGGTHNGNHDIVRHPSTSPRRPAGIVFVINANGYTSLDYHALAIHYARQGFLVKLHQRDSAELEVDDAIIDLLTLFNEFQIHSSTPVALVGHSKGGGTVIEMARQFETWLPGINLAAVISIAPNVGVGDEVTGFSGSLDTAYLAMYGSQDEDMQGMSGLPREGFAGYDRVGSEQSTACNEPGCLIFNPPPAITRSMVYVYGADHGGFVGHEGKTTWSTATGNLNLNDYLSVDDQLCIGKAYTTGFLRWHLLGDDDYSVMFQNDWRPPSIEAIQTAEPDYNCHFNGQCGAAGRDLRLFTQYSAARRKVLTNFESFVGLQPMSGVSAARVDAHASNLKSRHESRVLRAQWNYSNQWKRLRITLPGSQPQGIDSFDALSLRMGRFKQGSAFIDWTRSTSPWIGLADDQGGVAYARLGTYADIPVPDARGNDDLGTDSDPGHLHMRTIIIPLDHLSSVNLERVRHVDLWFRYRTWGDVIVDNIEAIRYD